MGELLAVMGGLFFALSTLLVQRGMRKASPFTGVTVNTLFSNFIFCIAFLWEIGLQGLPKLNALGILFAAGGGVAGNMLGRTLNYSAVRSIGAARSVPLTLTQTLFAFIFGWFLLREELSGLSILGMVLIIGGVYGIIQEKTRSEAEVAVSAEDKPALSGMLFALLAGFAFGGADILRKLGLVYMASAIETSAIGGLAALLFQILAVTFTGGWKEIRRLDQETWRFLALAGVASGIAVIMVNTALGLVPVAIVNALYSVRVWFVFVVAPILLGAEEKITKLLVGSTFLIMAGVLAVIFS